MRRIAGIILTIVVLAACEPRGFIALDPSAAAMAETETIFIGSTRAADPETGEMFSKERSLDPRYARLDVSIPPNRQPGEIVWPRPNRRLDPATEFLATKEVVYDGEPGFRADLAAAIRRERSGSREAIVYIHGFNSNFAEGAYRLAQLGHDLNLKGVFVHYSWPSRAHPLGYAYDRDSALFARDGLEDLLEEVEAAGAERILIIAHSMGSALTMETLRQIALENDRRLLRRISGVVLMSPDIDTDVFRAQAKRIGELPQPFVIFTSKKDRALALAARLTGQKDRLGNIEDVNEIADLKVTLLDTTAFSSGLGHFDLGNSSALLAILGGIADVDAAFAGDRAGRTGLITGAVLTVQSATQIVLSPVTAIAGSGP
ncbi:MAG: alpha/beta fold hydrolase [Paracoccaceae bacterium]